MQGVAAGLDPGTGFETTAVAILGPPGIGKTLLLHRAAALMCRREAEQPGIAMRRVLLPYSAVAFDDWCAWVLGQLHEPGEPAEPIGDPEATLRRWIAKHRMAGRTR